MTPADRAALRVRVYHSGYGCDTGCCGHVVEVDGKGEEFRFEHPWRLPDRRAWAEDLARRVIGKRWPDCLDSIDWDTLEVDEVTDDC